MILPVAPSWFVKRLHTVNAALGVRHLGPQGWQIVQYIPKIVDRGYWNGIQLSELVRMPEHVGYYKGLGSSILYELPRHYTGRYKGYNEFCEELKILH